MALNSGLDASLDNSQDWKGITVKIIVLIKFAAEFSTGVTLKLKTKIRGLSPPANYTERATAACRRS
jgi:hypothetical protein